MDKVNVMSHNINVVPAKLENGFVAQSPAQVEQLASTQDNVALVEQVNKPGQDDALLVQKEEAIEAENKEQVSKVEVEDAIDVVSSFINSTLKQVAFSHDSNAGKMVITMIDRETQEVINQFPSEKIISMAGRIKELHQEVENISGLLIDSHV